MNRRFFRQVRTNGDRPPPLEPLDDFAEVLEAEVIETTVVEDHTPEVPRAMPPRRDRSETPERDQERRPLLPAWLSDPVSALQAEAEWQLYRAKTHVARSPLYLGRALKYSPGGLFRTLAGLANWTRDDIGLQSLLLAQQQGNATSAERLQARHDHVWKSRLVVSVLAVLVLVLAGSVVPLALWSSGGLKKPLAGLGLAVSVLAFLGKVGEPGDHPIVEPLTVPDTGRRRITDQLIRDAFDAAGLSKPPTVLADGTIKGGKEIAFVTLIARKGKHGTQTTIDLPIGKTAEDALKNKAKIASGLSVGRMQVRITPDPESERRIELYVHDFDPYATEPPVSPLLDIAKFNFWDPIPFGISAEGEPINLSMIWTNLLIGAIPRRGKTFAARPIGAAAALDPRVRLLIFDGSGRGSWKAFRQISHRYGSGERDHVFDYLITTLQECWDDVQRRADKLEELDDLVKESKITPEIAADRKYDMPLTLVVIDEVQQYLTSQVRVAGRKRGEIVLELLTNLVKMGPAVGYMLLLTTQKPGSDVIPTDLRDQILTRFALKMMTSDGSRTILGDIPPGMDPVQFTSRHLGVGVLMGADNESLSDEVARIARTYFMDDEMVELICERAFKLRSSLGLLTGYAAGEDLSSERSPTELLDDVLECTGIDEEKLWTEVVLERLVASHPERYDGWTVEVLGSHLRSHRINTSRQISRTVNGEQTNRRGIVVEEVRDALARKLTVA